MHDMQRGGTGYQRGCRCRRAQAMSAEYLIGAIAAFVIYAAIFAASRLTPQDRRRRVTYTDGHIIGVDQDEYANVT